jgi:hypothetical protein
MLLRVKVLSKQTLILRKSSLSGILISFVECFVPYLSIKILGTIILTILFWYKTASRGNSMQQIFEKISLPKGPGIFQSV